jgi:hypothetical protein
MPLGHAEQEGHITVGIAPMPTLKNLERLIEEKYVSR